MKKILFSLAALSSLSFANERKFSYTYETATMPQGQVEVEAWNTLRFGKDAFYSALDQRLEIEWGLAHQAQGALYLNFGSQTSAAKDAQGNWIMNGKYIQLNEKHSFKGMSFEWKQQLLNSALNPLGFAYYAELGLQANEVELEGKLLFDKNFGKWTTALNLEGEIELEAEAEAEGKESKTEVEAEAYKWAADWGLSYALSPRLGLGLESRVHSVIEGDESEMAFFAGPNLSFGGDRFWGVITVLPQIGQKFDQHEQLESRLLMGFHF